MKKIIGLIIITGISYGASVVTPPGIQVNGLATNNNVMVYSNGALIDSGVAPTNLVSVTNLTADIEELQANSIDSEVWAGVSNAAYSALSAVTPDKWLVAGDSNTALNMYQVYEGVTNVYTDLLYWQVISNAIPSMAVKGIGISGENAVEGLARLVANTNFFTTETRDLYSIMFGANDINDGYTAKEAAANIEALATAALSYGADQILLIGYYGYGTQAPEIHEMNRYLKMAASSNGWGYVDTYEATIDRTLTPDAANTIWTMQNSMPVSNFHLNTNGQYRIAQLINGAILGGLQTPVLEEEFITASVGVGADGYPVTTETTGIWSPVENEWLNSSATWYRNGLVDGQPALDAIMPITVATSNLLLWIGAGSENWGTTSGTIYDYSSRDDHFGQATVAYQPAITDGRLIFDGADDYLRVQDSYSIVDGSLPWAIEWKGELDSGGDANHIIIGGASAVGGFGTKFTTPILKFRSIAGVYNESTNAAATATAIYGAEHTVRLSYDSGSTINVYIDDSQVDAFTNSIDGIRLYNIMSQSAETSVAKGELEYLRVWGTLQ